MYRKIKLLFVVIFALSLIGCSSNGGGSTNTPPSPPGLPPVVVPPLVFDHPDAPTIVSDENFNADNLSNEDPIGAAGPISVTVYDIAENTQFEREIDTLSAFTDRITEISNDFTVDSDIYELTAITTIYPSFLGEYSAAPYVLEDPVFGKISQTNRFDLIRSSYIEPGKTGIHWSQEDSLIFDPTRLATHTFNGREFFQDSTATARWWQRSSERLLFSPVNIQRTVDETPPYCETQDGFCGYFNDSAAYLGLNEKVIFMGYRKDIENIPTGEFEIITNPNPAPGEPAGSRIPTRGTEPVFHSGTEPDSTNSPYVQNILYVDAENAGSAAVAAAYATIILHQDPDMTPEELKEHLFNAASMVRGRHWAGEQAQQNDFTIHGIKFQEVIPFRDNNRYLSYEALMEYVEDTFTVQP